MEFQCLILSYEISMVDCYNQMKPQFLMAIINHMKSQCLIAII